MSVCSIEGCGTRVLARGWCQKHYSRWWNHGDPLQVIRPRAASGVCSVEGCGRKHKGHGYCGAHLRKVKLYGKPDAAGRVGPPTKGEHLGWGAVHKRITRARGAARNHICVDCGRPAQEWSYNGRDDNELVEVVNGYPLRYSLDSGYYEPRCCSCHRLFDNAARDQQAGEVSA